MSHLSLRQLIEDTAKALSDEIKFGYGRASDFNVISDKNYPFVWLDPLTSAFEFSNNNVQDLTKTWRCEMVFYKKDRQDSIQEQYQLILDEMDTLIDRFINNLNDADETAVISGITQVPVIKVMADVLTGWVLTFNISLLDDTTCDS